MSTRESAPTGAPCWTDLWTSDVAGSRTFYSTVFSWEAGEPSPEFGGYFMFTRDGVPVAGAMGDMGDMQANNAWKVYLQSDDMAKTIGAAQAAGGAVMVPAMEVADLGVQSVLTDSGGAVIGAWQPGAFPGFAVLDEPGAPCWFELFTRTFAEAVEFYRSVFGLEPQIVGDTDEFRYATLNDPKSGAQLAGIMDASAFLPEAALAHWSVYWDVLEADSTIAKIQSLGGSVVNEASDTPYGRIATVADPAGAQFKLRQTN